MKRNNKKKLPRYWLGTRKPTTLGYQPNKGIGDSLTSTNPGISVRPDVQAMRQNFVPSMIGRTGSSFQFPMQMAQTFTKAAPAGVGGAAAAAANPLFTTTSAGAVNGINTGSNLAASLYEHGAGKIVQQGTTKAAGALSTAGTALGAIGTAYGLYNVGTDIANAGDHRTVGNMRDTLTTNTYTTAGGNTYTEKTGLDTSGELEYENQNRKAKQMGLTLDSVGLGASVGGLVGGTALAGSVGGPLGMALGAGLGLVAGGLASLFGFGDNEDEIKEQMQILGDETARVNRQSRSKALDQDVKSAFYSGEASAALGKRPVWTPAGLANRKATARVSSGELIGNFQDGTVTRVAGEKNNKDTKLAALKNSDFVISNKFGLSDYAAQTGDYEGALNMQDILMKNYKNGKMPRYWGGKLGDYLMTGLPRLAEMALVQKNINADKTADVYAPDTYVDDAEGRKAVNILASQKFDERPYLYDATKQLNMANWAARRMAGVGLGGRAMLERMNFADYLNSIAKIHTTKNEMDVKNSQVYANALAALGAKNQQARMASRVNKHNWLQQAYGARFGALRSDMAQLGNLIATGAKDLYGVSKDQSANAYRDRMEKMLDRQLSNDKNKILVDAQNAAANRQLAAIMYGANSKTGTNSTAQSTFFDLPWWEQNGIIGQAARNWFLNQKSI